MAGDPSRQRRACAFALSAVLIWSTVATAFKLALQSLDPLQLLAVSASVATLTLGTILAVQGRLGQLRLVSRREAARSALLGALNPLLYYVLLFKAYALLPAQVAQPLNYTWAITLALLSVPLLGQRLTRRDLAAIGASYAGVVVLSTQGDLSGFGATDPLGVSLALASTLVWALYWIANAKSGLDPVLALFLNFVLALPLAIGAALLFSGPPPLEARGLLAAAYVGVFEMGAGFVLWLSALRLSDSAARMGNLIFLSPFLSLLFIGGILGERIHATTFAGLALILAGNLLQRRG